MGPALWLANSRQTWFLTRHPVPACAMRSVEEHLRGYDFAVPGEVPVEVKEAICGLNLCLLR